MSVVVVGATAGVGRALGRELAARGYSLLLVGRNVHDLEAERAHLRTTHGVAVSILVADAADWRAFAARVVDAVEKLDDVGALMFPIGASRSDDDGSLPMSTIEELLSVNLTCILAVCEALVPRMVSTARGGAIVGFSSVAASRGRSSNVVYSAAKRALESYFESLRHRLVGTGVHATVYRLGYVSSKQTFGKRLPFPIASPGRIATRVCDELAGRDGLRTFPPYWRPLTIAVQALPWMLFKRLKF